MPSMHERLPETARKKIRSILVGRSIISFGGNGPPCPRPVCYAYSSPHRDGAGDVPDCHQQQDNDGGYYRSGLGESAQFIDHFEIILRLTMNDQLRARPWLFAHCVMRLAAP